MSRNGSGKGPSLRGEELLMWLFKGRETKGPCAMYWKLLKTVSASRSQTNESKTHYLMVARKMSTSSTVFRADTQ